MSYLSLYLSERDSRTGREEVKATGNGLESAYGRLRPLTSLSFRSMMKDCSVRATQRTDLQQLGAALYEYERRHGWGKRPGN